MTIREVNREEFIRHTGSNHGVFVAPGFLNAMGDNVKFHGFFSNKEEWVGGFVTYRNSLRKIATLSPMPFSPHIGLYLLDIKGSESTVRKRTKDTLKAMATYLEAQLEPIIYCTFPPEWTDMQPFIWQGFQVSPRYTYQLRTDRSEEELMAGLDKGTRNLVRRAEKDGLSARVAEVEERHFELVSNTFSRKGIKVDRDALKTLMTNKEAVHSAFAIEVLQEDNITAVAYCLFDSNSAYYIAGGGDPEHRHQSAGTYALWSAILEAKKRGVEVFDFEGSMVPEIESFFRGFGGEMVTYHQVFRAPGWARTLLNITGFKP